jgi:hypothetical protein
LRQALSFGKAALTGRYVEPRIVQLRIAACSRCDLRQRDERGDWCGACGCTVSSAERVLTNLAAYEEQLPEWGCKHPRRAEGFGWPK